MAIGNFGTANLTFRQLMGNGLLYTVPRFQRDYSWTEEEWDDLWNDLLSTLSPEGESSHYMGYLVLQSKDSKNFDIIDGQQRITTLTILVLAVLKNLDVLKNIENNASLRADQIRSSFIGYLDPVTLVSSPKLTLNRNNNSLYKTYMVPLQAIPKRNLKATEHQMRKAFEWFETKVASKYKTGEDLARLVDQMADRLFFTVITVGDELNAYVVFETLNSRGVKLSSTDLLKNYFFSVVHRQQPDERELNELENRWEQLVSKLGSESFPDFLRQHWNSRRRFLRHSELFKKIREKVRDRGEVFALMREMETDVDAYVALSNPEDEFWKHDQRKYIKELRMFNVRQIFPLLIAAHRTLSESDFTILLRICSIISFRYNVIGNQPPNEQERLYTQIAERTHSQSYSLEAILSELKPLYPTDNEFKVWFEEKQLKSTQSRNKKIAMYILFGLEKRLSGKAYEQTDFYTLEYILPENPEENWHQVSDSDHEQFVYRLGNFTLLRDSVNRELGNAPYSVKLESYKASEFDLNKKIADQYKEWNVDSIANHQRWMANQAIAIWKVSQFE